MKKRRSNKKISERITSVKLPFIENLNSREILSLEKKILFSVKAQKRRFFIFYVAIFALPLCRRGGGGENLFSVACFFNENPPIE